MIGNVLSSLVGDLIHSSNSPRRQDHFKRELNLNPESPTFVKLYKMENKTRKSPCERDKGGGHHVKISSYCCGSLLHVHDHVCLLWPIVNVNTITDDVFLLMLSHHQHHQVYTVAQS